MRHENNNERVTRRQEIVSGLTAQGMTLIDASVYASDLEEKEELTGKKLVSFS